MRVDGARRYPAAVPTDPSSLELLPRAAELLALAIAPPLLSPEPAAPSSPRLAALGAGLALLSAIVLAARLRRSAGGPRRIGYGIAATVAASLIAAWLCAGPRGPLGRGLVAVAPLLWATLALGAHTLGARRGARASWGAAAMVLALGVGLFAPTLGWIRSADEMRWRALRLDGGDVRALDGLLAGAPTSGGVAAKRAVVDRCLATLPNACACLARGAELAVGTSDAAAAERYARTALDRCPEDAGTRAALALALASRGDGVSAEVQARIGLEHADDPRLHYALAVALQARGQLPEALASAQRAIALGAGRDAAVLTGALSIGAGDLDGAERALGPYARGDDAEALYDLALVHDRRGAYNRAREGYLAALRARPAFAEPRFNLALLTFRFGAVAEARHHAAKFAQAFPADPRAATLASAVGGAKE